MCYY
jgi:hypothetical protein